ncbi:hypothetical protein [Paraglaciecola marina]|uniref:hypothetical protein n=1 Tax=Paraglaciecola marina TaxID=2500157 RepID=UPI001061FA21|nr:hypothetical protein [Paraglaciecola marina]
MKSLTLFASICLCLCISSCATKVTTIKNDGTVQLKQEEGYLLIAIKSNINLNEILINGEKYIKLTAEDLRLGSSYILVNLPAGDYTIDEIKLNRYIHIDDFEDDIWDFSVQKNTISYVGHLDFQTRLFSNYSQIKLINKSSIALEYLEEEFPEMLTNYSVQYQGPGQDRFFDVIGVSGNLEGN